MRGHVQARHLITRPAQDKPNINGTVALRVDLLAMQEIFRLTFAPSRQPAAMPDWHGSYWRGWVGRYWPGPGDLRRPALEIAQRNSAHRTPQSVKKKTALYASRVRRDPRGAAPAASVDS